MRARLPKKSTGVADSCGQGCRRSPQAWRIRAGKVASFWDAQRAASSCRMRQGLTAFRTALNARPRAVFDAVSVKRQPAFGVPVRKTSAKVPCRVMRMGLRAPCAQAHGHRLMGTDSCAQARAHRLGEHRPRVHGIDLVPSKLPLDATKGPLPGGYPGFGSGSGAVPHGAPVTGEVTATRRFGVLQMSGLRSKVPLHLVATRV